MKIRADLRFLTIEQEVNDYILLGPLGTEATEIIQISGISSTTLTVGATVYDHPQDTTVVKIDYNKINFFHSSTTTGVLTALNGSPQSITPDEVFNYYD